MITLKVSVSGTLRSIETRVQALSDLEVPMELWNKYKRKQVQGIFDAGGPGWPEKKGSMGPHTADQAKSAENRLKAKADDILRTKLRAELRRAQRKHARGKGNEAKSAATVARRYAVLKAFEKLAAGGVIDESDFGGDAKLAKSVTGLHARAQRASAKAASKPLGRMASSIKSKVTKTSVEIYSTIPWAGAHNKGATVGHGAQLPKREFLDITEADVAVLLMLIEMHLSSRG